MARKRKQDPTAEGQPDATPDNSAVNTTAPAETPSEQPAAATAGPGPAVDIPPTKKEAVRLALAARVTSPTEIAEYLKKTWGMEISAAHVSTTKGLLKREKEQKKLKARAERRKAKAAEEPQAPPPAPATSSEPGLTTQDLRALVEMAERVGGVDRLQEFLDVLKPRI